MVALTVEGRGIRDPRVLSALREVPRHLFVPPELSWQAYEDAPLPIGEGQTISQPYVVALMAQALGLSPGDRVLEVGTGSGYGAAVLSRLAAEVFTIERHEALARTAAERLGRVGYANVSVLHGDGSRGWPAHAPYQGIAVTAAGPRIPEPLLWQLAPGGRLVMPVGKEDAQQLIRVTRDPSGAFRTEDLGAVRFVPLVRGPGSGLDPGDG
ncbi:MAG: protein-L-isoaspartate(D-aspartate) O-methyltransferase [Myxococcaceae bacterium]